MAYTDALGLIITTLMFTAFLVGAWAGKKVMELDRDELQRRVNAAKAQAFLCLELGIVTLAEVRAIYRILETGELDHTYDKRN